MDLHPIRIGKFVLTATGLEVNPHAKTPPRLTDYQGLGDYLALLYRRVPWWLASWAAYGLTRSDWGKWARRLPRGLSEETLGRLQRVGRAIPEARRDPWVEYALHEAVARLSPEAQVQLLAEARALGAPNPSEFRRMIRVNV